MPVLDREEYIEQAYFFRAFRERVADGMPAQEVLARIGEELLSTTKLPMAVAFISTDCRSLGLMGPAMARLGHYFTPFQSFVVSRAEEDVGRFAIDQAMLILEREAKYRADVPTVPGLFVYQFEALSRNRLGYGRGLDAMAADPMYDEDWQEYIVRLRSKLGDVDFADLIYVRSAFFVAERRRLDPEYVPKFATLFGEKEGKIARANRGRDPVYLFSALQRQLNYPEVPRPKRPDEAESRIAALEARVLHLENRLKSVEVGANPAEINIADILVKPEDTAGRRRVGRCERGNPTSRSNLVMHLLGVALLLFAQSKIEVERTVIDADFPGAYQVEVADVDGDGKPDVVAVGGGTCAWYENPTWKKRIVTGPDRTPGIISSATADLDGDGKAEIAIAYEFEMNEPKRGKLRIASQGKTPDDPWALSTIAEDFDPIIGSIHRLRWGNFLGNGMKALAVAPIFSVDSEPPGFAGPAHLRVNYVADGSRWRDGFMMMFPPIKYCHPVTHAIDVVDVNGDGRNEILTASNDGVNLAVILPAGFGWGQRRLVAGTPGAGPKKGASEVHLGMLADDLRLLATVEPWHGNKVVVYLSDGPKSLKFGPPTVIDDTLDEGHALWVADVDGDGSDEVFAGHRGKDHRVSMYRRDGDEWTRTVIDREVAAQDLRGGDLDGDGTPEVVTVGGSTHNVVLYKFKKSP